MIFLIFFQLILIFIFLFLLSLITLFNYLNIESENQIGDIGA
jgi:hypothetical protein